MIKIVHRVNSTRELTKIPVSYGVEVDIRGYGDELVLNHEPLAGGENFEGYLKEYGHAFAIFNIKEAGIEQRVIDLAGEFNITNFFLLDVEFPFIYKATRCGFRSIAIRYSEDECIDSALLYKSRVDWVWIDTNTRLPLDRKVVEQLRGIKTCLVSPDRWGRPNDILKYKQQMKALNFEPTAVMAGKDVIHLW